MAVARGRRADGVGEEGLEPLHVDIAEVRQSQPGREGFELGPDPVRLGQLCGPGSSDPSALEGGHLHDSEGLEVAQRLPDRCLADAEVTGDPCLDDPGTGRVLTGQDGLQEDFLDLVAEDAARDRGHRSWLPA